MSKLQTSIRRLARAKEGTTEEGEWKTSNVTEYKTVNGMTAFMQDVMRVAEHHIKIVQDSK